MTELQQHIAEWRDCRRCPLCETRASVCLVRGKVPADILFVGEAPGLSEDCLGYPFAGPAGHLLDEIIARAIPPALRIVLSNLVACLPVDPETGAKAVEPSDASVKACAPRLVDLARICRPRLIVCVGSVASRWLDSRHRPRVEVDPAIPMMDIVHPAFILRSNVAMRGLQVQRCVVKISTAIEENHLCPQ